MSLQMSSCLSYSFVTYPSPKLIFKATLIKQNESSTLCPVATNFYSLLFFFFKSLSHSGSNQFTDLLSLGSSLWFLKLSKIN